MVNREEHYVEWAMLMYELEDAHEHLGNLIKEIHEEPDYSTGNFRVDLGHVYAHLNRAWFRHDKVGELTDEQRDQGTQFPTNLDPNG